MAEAIATNKKAYRDYFLSDFRECGIALIGGEVKSIRSGHVNFTDSFVRIEKGEALLYNLHIDAYLQASYMNQIPDRVRKLLLHKREINKLAATITKGVVIVPTKIYFNKKGFVKVEIAVGRGKKSYDKRETIKKREVDKQIQRRMKK